MSITVLVPASAEQGKKWKYDGLVGDQRVVIVGDNVLLAAKRSMTKGKWARVISTLQLWTAYQSEDSFAIHTVLAKLKNYSGMAEAFSVDSAAEFALPEEFEKLVEGSRLVLWRPFKSDHVEIAVLCSNLAQALLVRKALDGLGVCLACGKTFTQNRTDEMFCSKRCGNRFRKQRQRSKGGKAK